MKDKKLSKRIISFGLSVILVLGLAIGHLPGGIFYNVFSASNVDFSLSASELALGANVIPVQMKNNSSFMSKYIYNGNLNLNSNFKLSSWKNIDSDISMKTGDSLTRSKLMHQKNKGWEANYVWNMTDAQKSLIQNRSYILVYNGNVFADYHYNVFINANKHWDVGTATLFRSEVQLDHPGYAAWQLKAEEQSDEQAQAVTKEIDYIPLYDNALTFRAEHSGCSCGSSGVSNSIFYMYDNSNPYVEDAYICRNADGTGKLNSGDGFTANKVGYVVLDFSENIRFSDNVGKKLTLNLDAYYCENNLSVDSGIISAELISLEDDKLIFQFTVPEKIGNELTNVYISGISKQQEFVDSQNGFKLSLYKGDGSEAVGTSEGYTVANYITDIAGNPMDWNASDKGTGKIYLDNIKPVMTNITMSGSMINDTSATSKDSWPDDIDRSSVFAGVGDTISFCVYFSESIKGFDTNTVKAVLNIKDSSGNYIELGVSKNNGSNIQFDTLTITENMTMDNYGEPIVITGFKGLEGIVDRFGNEMVDDLTKVTMTPAQGIYLDVDAPSISADITLGDNETVYTPYSDAEGEYFTFPIKISEDISKAGNVNNTSTITGKEAYVSLLMNGTKNFEWYIDTNRVVDKNAEWKSATTGATVAEAAKCAFSPVDGQTYYIHIKLDANTDYDYAKNLTDLGNIYFVGSIYVSAQDYAKNSSNATYNIQHQVDTEEPTGSVSDNVNLTVDYETGKGTLITDLQVQDGYALKSLTYYWTYTPYELDESENLVKGTKVEQEHQTVSFSEGLSKEYSNTTSYEFYFSKDDNGGRKGEAYLTIEFEDYSGRSGRVKGETYLYDFTKSIPSYTIKTGSKEIPILMPEIIVSAPISTDGSTLADSTRTIFAIPYEVNEDGTYNYYIWDSFNYRASSESVEYTVNDIFAELKAYYENGSAYTGAWSNVTGTFTKTNGGVIVADNVAEITDPNEVYEYISNIYGELEIMIITSSDFTKSYTDLTGGTGYSYTAENSDVESYIVYLDNRAKFEVKLTDIQKDGKDVTDDLNYEAGEVPAQNIDNVALTFTIQNITGKTDTTAGDLAGYGLFPLDIANCKVDLYYCAESNQYTGTLIHTWTLDKVNTQTLIIPEGIATETGWYRVAVTLCNINGESTTTKMENYFFMDTHVSDVMIHEYYKAYDHDYLSVLKAKDEKNLEDSVSLDVALDTAPDGWSLNTYITFGRTDRTDEVTYGIQENVRMRVYNCKDANGKENAIWVDVSGWDANTKLYYTPVAVTEFTDTSYGAVDALVLPLMAGENKICYEIESTNGVVTSHEIVMYAYTEAVELDLDVEYTKISSRTGEVMEFTVSPIKTLNMDLAKSKFNLIDRYNGYTDAASYTFSNDIDNEFYLLDQNGNLSTEQCVVKNVDGISPYGNAVEYDPGYDTCFSAYVNFADWEGEISSEEIWLTFDAYYSAILMGLTGEERLNNTEQITIAVPLNCEQDEQGNYITWESYSDDYYGIYRTQVSQYGSDDNDAGNLSFQIWGTWKCDPEDSNTPERKLTFTTMDANGNEFSVTANYTSYAKYTPFIGSGVYVDGEYEDGINIDLKLDENGYVGIYFDRPLLDVDGYGAGQLKEGYTLGQRQLVYYTTAPMIVEDGNYTFEVTDLFGNTYEAEFSVDVFEEMGIHVTFSEIMDTRNDVVVTAEAISAEGSVAQNTITSITGVTDSEEIIEVSIDENNPPTVASITMPENGKVTITTSFGNERVVTVSNIDKTLEPASVIFVNSMGEEITTSETTLYEKVTAMVICDELLVGTNGKLNYTFPLGSVSGDTYTFEYADKAGNTGSITAVLPYNLVNASGEEPIDESAPDFILSTYGMRDRVYSFIGEIANPCDVDNGDGTIDNSDSVEVSNTLRSYIAQKYKLILDIEDDSNVKILVQEAGSTAPVSYADAVEGSSVEHVSLSENTIIIEENTSFDIYVIDEANNVTALTNIVVDSIDNVAVNVNVTYEVGKNDLEEAIVIATFVPEEGLAQITAVNQEVLSKWVTVGNVNVLRYYYILTENGSYEFTYKDEYGNYGKAIATVKGMNNSPAIVNSVIWHGTRNNEVPSEESVAVNKDVIASLNMSKAVSDVQLYVYVPGDGALGADNLGAAIGTDVPVEVSFTSNNVYITYEKNVDYQIIAVFTAAENGKKGYCLLPAVTCIDKTAPTVTVAESELAEDKRSKTFVFETSEDVLFSKNNTGGYAKRFEWTATSNAATELIFTDKAGNITKYQITSADVSDVDTRYLSVSFSASADGANETNNPIEDLNIAVGGDVYVKATKSAVAYVNNVEIGTLAANTWNKVALPEKAGLHVLKLVDTNTGEILYKTIAAQPKDNVAPVITFDVATITLDELVSVDTMMEAIYSGVSITDNKDGAISDYTVTGYPSTVKRGLYELTYKAEDAAGNVVQATRNLYIIQEGTPLIRINGEPAVPYGTTVIYGYDVELEVEGLDTDLLTVKYKSGIKTVGQMKYGTTTVENMKFTVTKEGFYTIYIRTQDRIELITHIYVEE